MNEWNNKAVEITGFSVDDIMGRNLVEEFILVAFLYILTHARAHHARHHAFRACTLYATLHTRTDVCIHAHDACVVLCICMHVYVYVCPYGCA